jgi:hypothetical protein
MLFKGSGKMSNEQVKPVIINSTECHPNYDKICLIEECSTHQLFFSMTDLLRVIAMMQRLVLT